MNKVCRIKYFPISFFSVILGMAGLTIVYQRAEKFLDFPFYLSDFLIYLTLMVFIIITFIYFIKIFKYPLEVKDEIDHPVKLSFFPTFSISLLLLSIAFLQKNIQVSKIFWFSGTIFHTYITFKVIAIWIEQTKFKIHHISPAWFIPIVGNIIIPVAGVVHVSIEISWFFYSIGIVFWLVLFTIFFYRIIFHHPLQEKLIPTFFILIAPAAVGFISYVKLNNEVDNFARVLYYFALFMTFLLLSRYKMFFKIKFYLSWWAYSFPIASITLATILFYHLSEYIIFAILSYIFTGFLTIFILLIIFKTINAIRYEEICIEE